MAFVIQCNIFNLQDLDILRLRPPQKCFYSRNQLHNRKWFLNIIIRTFIQSFDHIHFCCLCCHHNNWQFLCSRIFPQFTHNIIPALVRKHDIQKHQIRHNILQLFIKSGCLFKGTDHIIAVFQCNRLNFPDILIIFHDINQCHNFSLCLSLYIPLQHQAGRPCLHKTALSHVFYLFLIIAYDT